MGDENKLDKYNSVNWEDFVYYDETSPTFLRWKVARIVGNGAILRVGGDIAGHTDNSGYSKTNLFGKLYLNHRIIWCLVHGCINTGLQVDHVDGDRGNNKIGNLRLVVPSANNRNQGMHCNNTTGVTGVSLNNNGGGRYYYTANWWTIDGKRKLKCFSITKLGESEAFRLACEYRTNTIDELNSQGAGYTERHGD